MKKLSLVLLFSFYFILSYYSQNKNLDKIMLKGRDSKDSSSFYFEKAYGLLQTKADTANYYYAVFYNKDSFNQYDSSRYYAKKAIPLLKEINDLEKLRKIHEISYYQYLGFGQYDDALVEIHAALKYAQQLKDTAHISLHYSDISILYHDYNFFKKGIFYGKKAFRIMNNAKNKKYKYLIFANNAIAINFDDWNKPDSALFYHYKNLKYFTKVEDSLRYGFVLNNIANTNLKIKNYKKAKEFLQRSLVINLLGKRDYNLASNYTNLATIAYKENQNSEAIQYFKKAHEHAYKSGSIEKMRDLLEQEYLFYKKNKNFEKAMKKQEAFYALRDSVFNTSRLAKIAQLEIEFDTEKKEKEIAEQKVNIAKQQLKVKQRNYTLLGLGLVVVFILTLSFFIYKQQKLKQQKLVEENKLKDQINAITVQNELHEERLRISRDLHDNIGSQLTFIISSVDNMKYLFKSADEKLNSKLSDVSSFTRTTITQLRDTIWALNKDKISFEALKSRLYNYIENAQLAQEQTAFNFDANLTSNFQLNPVQGVCIYRIVQEAINNSIKYAAATTINLTITETPEAITLSIIDDGIGFNMAEIQLGNGLENMKNRASEINAEFNINSTPDKGTEITLTLLKITLN